MKHLLFLPAPPHAAALLGEGVGGSRPPVAVFCSARYEKHELDTDAHGFVCLECQEDWPCGQPDREIQSARWQEAARWEWERKGAGRPAYPPDGALILVWNGAPAQEGCDRLYRAVVSCSDQSPGPMERWWSDGDARHLADAAVAAGLGTTNEVIEEAP